ncbi:hypothetical protein [Bradyrhizobium sp. HKCCYLS20291]|uniref:hypothetical protein n=1 Tax=Bradyrhizobium sp. HKCCYLS20291 TaxID=3420766 RepID=UPI003EC0CFDE
MAYQQGHWQEKHWHTPIPDPVMQDDGAYLTGWTISGIAVIGTIVAVWLLGI